MARSMVNCAQLEKNRRFFIRFYCMNEEKILIDLIFSGKNFASTDLLEKAIFSRGQGGGRRKFVGDIGILGQNVV